MCLSVIPSVRFCPFFLIVFFLFVSLLSAIPRVVSSSCTTTLAALSDRSTLHKYVDTDFAFFAVSTKAASRDSVQTRLFFFRLGDFDHLFCSMHSVHHLLVHLSSFPLCPTAVPKKAQRGKKKVAKGRKKAANGGQANATVVASLLKKVRRQKLCADAFMST